MHAFVDQIKDEIAVDLVYAQTLRELIDDRGEVGQDKGICPFLNKVLQKRKGGIDKLISIKDLVILWSFAMPWLPSNDNHILKNRIQKPTHILQHPIILIPPNNKVLPTNPLHNKIHQLHQLNLILSTDILINRYKTLKMI